MKNYLAELHIHTVLSPCGDLMMTPLSILESAKKRGIELIAITDHNSAENLAVTLALAPKYGIHVLPGMEVETKEEVHLVALFDTLEGALALQEIVYKHLPLIENDENFFGPQLLCDLDDNYCDRVTRFLAGSISLSLEEVVAEVEKLSGLIYPAHVDRKRNSILTQLGFIPPGLHFPALEVSPRYFERNENLQLLQEYPLIPAGDVHYIQNLTGTAVFTLDKPGLTEIKKALIMADGRSFHWRR